jgi:hypothetical protein
MNFNSLKNMASDLDDNKKGIYLHIKKYKIISVEDNDRVVIDNEPLNIKNQMNVIANKILKKCNVINHKNKNNNKALLTGDGKLMITNGLTLAEFEKKFNLHG